MLRFCRGQRLGYVLSHAWLLFQARLDPPYFACAWCAYRFPVGTDHFQRFLHVAWACPTFMRHWQQLRRRVHLRDIPSLSDLALGIGPHGETRLGSAARQKAIALHAAMWRLLRSEDPAGRPAAYERVVAYFLCLHSRPDFFEAEIAPSDPPGLLDPG